MRPTISVSTTPINIVPNWAAITGADNANSVLRFAAPRVAEESRRQRESPCDRRRMNPAPSIRACLCSDQSARSSGARAAIIRRIPSRHGTAVFSDGGVHPTEVEGQPPKGCRSVWTNFASSPVRSAMCSHHCFDADRNATAPVHHLRRNVGDLEQLGKLRDVVVLVERVEEARRVFVHRNRHPGLHHQQVVPGPAAVVAVGHAQARDRRRQLPLPSSRSGPWTRTRSCRCCTSAAGSDGCRRAAKPPCAARATRRRKRRPWSSAGTRARYDSVPSGVRFPPRWPRGRNPSPRSSRLRSAAPRRSRRPGRRKSSSARSSATQRTPKSSTGSRCSALPKRASPWTSLFRANSRATGRPT